MKAVKRLMPADDVSTSLDVKRMRTASTAIPADVPSSCASASSWEAVPIPTGAIPTSTIPTVPIPICHYPRENSMHNVKSLT